MHNRTFRAVFVFSPLSFILFLFLGCGGSPKIQNSFCSACQFVYATTNSAQILTFRIDNTTGSLGAPSSISGPANSGGLMAWPQGVDCLPIPVCTLYVSDAQDGAIHVYTISHADGTLAPASVGPFPLGNGGGAPGEMAALGNTLYVASSAGSIFAFTVNADGSLTSVAGSPFSAGAGVSHLAVINSSAVSNTNLLYTANTGDSNGSISAFSIAANGALVPVPGSPFSTLSGAAPEGLFASGKFLYIAMKNANAVAAFAIANDGSLTSIAGSPFPAGSGTFSLNGAGGFLFATNNLDGTISSYSIDSSSGVLTPVAGSPFPGAVTSGDTVISPNGNGKLFVPNGTSNGIDVFVTVGLNGAVSPMMGSPFPAGATPVALTTVAFVAVDP